MSIDLCNGLSARVAIRRKPAASLLDDDGNVLCDLYDEHGALVGDTRESGCATFIRVNGVTIPLQTAFAEASNHAKDAIADVERYAEPMDIGPLVEAVTERAR